MEVFWWIKCEFISELSYINFVIWIMLQEHLFLNEWGIWFCFLSDPNESNEKYYQNFLQVYTVRTPADLAYVWTHHNLNNLDHFLLQSNSKQNTYLVKDKWRRVNSLEYFKKGIQPKWQDPRNAKGGRFVFPVGKEQANKSQIYTNLVFYLLGEDFNFSEHINGFRFISPKNSQTFYRVQIWVDFDKENTEVLIHFQNLLTALFQNLNFDSKSVHFLNNRSQPVVLKEGKDDKKGK